MNAPPLPLFRDEVVRKRVDSLHGAVSISTPVAWQALGFLLIIVILAGGVFLAFASYSRVAIVSGSVVLDKGVATILATRSGVVEHIPVKEGDRVASGQNLATIRAEESPQNGSMTSSQIGDALRRQDDQLSRQGALLIEAGTAETRRIQAQVQASISAISALESQIADQRILLNTAESDYEGARAAATRGFISKRDMDQRRATILTRHQQLVQLEQALAEKNAEIRQARRAIEQSQSSARAQAIGTESARSNVSQQQAQINLTKGYSLVTSMPGSVTALTARVGQAVTAGQQLMMVVPADAQLRTELYVPTSAAAFLARGQEVRLSIDAFPYQTFGVVEGRILTISSATVTRQGPNGAEPAYLIVASIPRPWVMAFGVRRPLVAGMTLTARIVTEKRSLFEWLFEPVLAVGKR